MHSDSVLADSQRSSPSLLARQLRLRLIADDDSDVPRNLQNMVVSIHAIATFQALNDYLRPRVAGLTSSGRLSNMLAAAPGFGLAATSRVPPDHEAGQPTVLPAVQPSLDAPTPASDLRRRRSQRLSAKNANSGAPVSDNASSATTSSTSASDNISRREEPLVQESELATELTDDEVDAEVSFHLFGGELP